MESATQAAVESTQPINTDQAAPESAQAATASPKEDSSKKLNELLKREKEDPNVKFTDQELDVLEAHWEDKTKPTKPEKEEKEEAQISEPKEEEFEETPDTEESENKEQKADPDAEAILKEVGAKNLKEAISKIKDLRKALSGKDAQAVATLSKENERYKSMVSNETKLYEDIRKGVPEAIAHFEKSYGLKLAGNDQPRQVSNAQAKAYIDESKFIDPESAQLVNSAFSSQSAEIESLKAQMQEILSEKTRYMHETASKQAELSVLDEMVKVAQKVDALKGVPNLRDAVTDFYKGKQDSRFDVLSELFQIADENKVSLELAYQLKRGMDADRLVLEAENKGRKSAFEHKPNPSLSGLQGGNGETSYKPLSEEQIDSMAEDHRLMPADWFDKEEQPIQNKIPKKAWRLFGFK